MTTRTETYVEQKFEPVKFVDGYGKNYTATTNELKDQNFKYCLDPFDRFYDVGKEVIGYKTVYNQSSGAETKEKVHNTVIWNARISTFLLVEKPDIIPATTTTTDNIPNYFNKEKDKEDYIRYIIALYKSKNVSDFAVHLGMSVIIDQQDSLFMSRMALKKDHPGILKYFDERNPNSLDIIDKIERIIRFYKNNNNYNSSDSDIVKYAYEYLKVIGITTTEGFKEAWELLTDLYKLSRQDIS